MSSKETPQFGLLNMLASRSFWSVAELPKSVTVEVAQRLDTLGWIECMTLFEAPSHWGRPKGTIVMGLWFSPLRVYLPTAGEEDMAAVFAHGADNPRTRSRIRVSSKGLDDLREYQLCMSASPPTTSDKGSGERTAEDSVRAGGSKSRDKKGGKDETSRADSIEIDETGQCIHYNGRIFRCGGSETWTAFLKVWKNRPNPVDFGSERDGKDVAKDIRDWLRKNELSALVDALKNQRGVGYYFDWPN